MCGIYLEFPFLFREKVGKHKCVNFSFRAAPAKCLASSLEAVFSLSTAYLHCECLEEPIKRKEKKNRST